MTATTLIDANGIVRSFDQHGHEQRPLSDLQITQLLADLSVNRVAHRNAGGSQDDEAEEGGDKKPRGRQLSYLEGWDDRRMLIRIFGFGGFSIRVNRETLLSIKDGIPKSRGTGTNWRAVYQASVSVHIHQLGADYDGAAVSSQLHPDPGEAADFALKTAVTDALKVACTNLGTQFGLSLYDNGRVDDIVQRTLAPGQTQFDTRYLRSERRKAELTAMQEVEEIEAKVAELVKAREDAGKTGDSPSEQDTPDKVNLSGRLEGGEDENDVDGTPPPTEEALEGGRATVQSGFEHPEKKA